jgi:hypothetical protein
MSEPLSEALLNFYTFPPVAVIFSLLEEKREGHLEELYLQVVLRRVQLESRSSICFTFQDERLLGFTLVTLIFIEINKLSNIKRSITGGQGGGGGLGVFLTTR